MNNWITPMEIVKEIKEIGSYEGHFDSLSGTLEWFDKEREITIYATPNWETEGEVPFDVNLDNEIGYHNVCTIKMVKGDKSTQLTHYLNVLMMIMNHYKDCEVDSFKTWNEAPYGNDDEDEEPKFRGEGTAQAVLDYVDRKGAVSHKELHEYYKSLNGSNTFSWCLRNLRIPYKNRKTQRYLAKEGKIGSNAKWVVKIANPSNWVVKQY